MQVLATQVFDLMADATCGAIVCPSEPPWDLCHPAECLSPMERLNL
jgi:hypothetical protein